MTHPNFLGRDEPDPPFANDDERQQYQELQAIINESRRGSQTRRDAIEELRNLRRVIETRDRRDLY